MTWNPRPAKKRETSEPINPQEPETSTAGISIQIIPGGAQRPVLPPRVNRGQIKANSVVYSYIWSRKSKSGSRRVFDPHSRTMAAAPARPPLSLYRQILASSGIYGIALMAQRLVSIVLLPLYTRYLAPADYGKLELIGLTVGIFALFVGATFSYSLMYFLSRARDASERASVISTSILGAGILGALGGVLGFAAAPLLNRLIFAGADCTGLFRLAFAALAASLPLDMCYACLRSLNRAVAYCVASLVTFLSSAVAAIFGLVVLHMGISALLWANLLVTFAMAVSLAFVCLRRAPLAFRPGLFAAQLRYAFPTLFVGLSQTA